MRDKTVILGLTCVRDKTVILGLTIIVGWYILVLGTELRFLAARLRLRSSHRPQDSHRFSHFGLSSAVPVGGGHGVYYLSIISLLRFIIFSIILTLQLGQWTRRATTVMVLGGQLFARP